jgi:MFS family permease
MVSQSGDYIFDVVALWLVLQLTGDIFKVGLTTATILLPPVVIGPLAGVYVDKFNRRDIILVSNIFQAAAVAAIAVLYGIGGLSFPVLLVLLFLLNAGAQFVRPSVTAIIPGLMTKEDLATANSLFTISSSLNQIAGFGIGGLLVLLLGVELPIYYDSFTFLFAAGTVVLIARSVLDVPPIALSASSIDGENASSFKDKFLQGLRFIRTSRLLLEIIALALVLNFFGGGIQALIAPYAKITVHGNAGTYGAMLAALSLGTVIGSIVVGKEVRRKTSVPWRVGNRRLCGSHRVHYRGPVQYRPYAGDRRFASICKSPAPSANPGEGPRQLAGTRLHVPWGPCNYGNTYCSRHNGWRRQLSADRSHAATLRGSHADRDSRGVFRLPRGTRSEILS